MAESWAVDFPGVRGNVFFRSDSRKEIEIASVINVCHLLPPDLDYTGFGFYFCLFLTVRVNLKLFGYMLLNGHKEGNSSTLLEPNIFESFFNFIIYKMQYIIYVIYLFL